MKLSKRKFYYKLCAILALVFAGSVSFGSMLPDGLVIEDIFKPGLGTPVGQVVLVQGEAVILHGGEMRGYWAKKDLPLFQSDTIITMEKGRIRFKLNGESIMTLASNSKMVITQNVYDLEKKTRTTFLGMDLGKARFWVKKLVDPQYSKFKVKTPTAVVGVRGSEWIEEVTDKFTRVTTLEDTILGVISVAAPEVPPVVLQDFEKTLVEKGELPTEVEKVTPEEAEQLKKDFVISPVGGETEEKVEKEKAVKQEKAEILISANELSQPEEPASYEEYETLLDMDLMVDESELYESITEAFTEDLIPPVPPVEENTGGVTIGW